ncbi:hypothetical protein BC941DRAFT_477098 [Chlamydoabsidia padenii]|nr:hypothetical protein BC941DRAFT_477098 [Chlamydoabsidia padenii]
MHKRAYKGQSSPSSDKRKKQALHNTTQESWKHYFQDGRQAFEANQYKEALDYFTQALTLQPNQLTLLDSRAATLEKLNEWDLAKNDATTMIKLDPTSSKGYLRYGKLLSLQQRYSSAAKVYRRGCERANDARHHLLVSMKNDMEAKARIQQVQCDPMAILPYDVLDLIFSSLPFHRRLACMQVSTSWRRFLLHWSGMWRNMDLVTGSFKYNSVSRKTLAQYLSYTQGRHLRRFSISLDRAKTDYALQLLIDQNCHYLEYLGLAHASFTFGVFARTLRLMGKHLTHLYLDNCDERFDSLFKQVATTCPQLSHLYYGSDIKWPHQPSNESKHIYSNLKQLHLVIDMTEDALKVVLDQCPNLTHLVLPRISLSPAWILRHAPSRLRVYYQASSLTRSSLWDNNHTSDKEGLTAFTVIGSTTLDDNTLTTLITNHRQTLETINLNQSTGFGHAWCRLYLESPSPSPLVELKLEQCTTLSESNLESLISSCPLLQRVVVSYNQGVTNHILQVLAMLVSLKTLDISACLRITGSGVRYLVDQRQHSLETLCMNDCMGVQPDAIQHARSVLKKGVVQCVFGKRR